MYVLNHLLVFGPSLFLVYCIVKVNTTIIYSVHVGIFYFIPILLYCISLINAYNDSILTLETCLLRCCFSELSRQKFIPHRNTQNMATVIERCMLSVSVVVFPPVFPLQPAPPSSSLWDLIMPSWLHLSGVLLCLSYCITCGCLVFSYNFFKNEFLFDMCVCV